MSLRSVVVLTGLCVALPAASEPKPSAELTKMIDDIIAKTARLRSLEVKSTVVLVMEDVTMTTTATMQMQRKATKVLSRIESRVTMKSNCKQPPCKRQPDPDSMSIEIFDGMDRYKYQETAGKKTATKEHADEPRLNLLSSARYADLKKNKSTTRLPDAKVNGKPVYVLDMIGPINLRATLRVDQATGVILEFTLKDESSEWKETFSDVKLDAEIPAERFVFKAPAGVTVTDGI